MEGLYYLAFIVAIYVVIQWYITNETAKTDRGDLGPMAMKSPDSLTESKAERRNRRKPPRYLPYGED